MTREPPTTLDYFTAPLARRARFVAWVVCVICLLGGTLLWLYLSRDQLIFRDATLIGGWGVLGLILVVLLALLNTTPAGAVRLSAARSCWIILAGAAALQLLAIVLLIPALSEDVQRYRLDGGMWLDGLSPYVLTPSERIADVLWTRGVGDGTLHSFPHRDLHSIYPPIAQVTFVVARSVEDALVRPSGEPGPRYDWRGGLYYVPKVNHALVHRALFGLLSVCCALVLLKFVETRHDSAWWAVLFSWNPLLVIETGGMGHVDVVGVLFVLLTIRALQSHRPILAAAMLALAAGVKPHVVLLAPFLVRDAIAAGSRVQLKWLAVAFVSFLALVYSPMLYQQGFKGWLKTSRVYATSWEANGSIYDLIKSTADEADGVAVQRAKDGARALAAAAVVVTMLIAWFARADLATAGYWVFLVALLFSPVVYPWYLLWVLCFVPLLRGWQGITALVWAATVGVSYLLWRTSDWVLPTRWLLVEYVPVYAALLLEVAMLLIGSSNHRRIESLKDGSAPSPMIQ